MNLFCDAGGDVWDGRHFFFNSCLLCAVWVVPVLGFDSSDCGDRWRL